MYANIVCAGGNTVFDGLTERLAQEVAAVAPPGWRVQVVDGHKRERKNAAWIGGSILSALSSFEHCFFTKEEYDDVGPTIVNRKFVG